MLHILPVCQSLKSLQETVSTQEAADQNIKEKI